MTPKARQVTIMTGLYVLRDLLENSRGSRPLLFTDPGYERLAQELVMKGSSLKVYGNNIVHFMAIQEKK